MTARPTRIVIFAKAPIPGKVKTRLIPVLGAVGAARLARQMLMRTVAEAIQAGLGPPELCAAPDPLADVWHGFIPDGVRLSSQGEGDLGDRLSRAAARVLSGGENILLIGTDCPGLTASLIRTAAAALEATDAVIHPATDGGYVLLGLRKYHHSLFESIPWSTNEVGRLTIDRITALGLSVQVSETLADIDEPGDLPETHGIPKDLS